MHFFPPSKGAPWGQKDMIFESLENSLPNQEIVSHIGNQVAGWSLEMDDCTDNKASNDRCMGEGQGVAVELLAPRALTLRGP